MKQKKIFLTISCIVFIIFSISLTAKPLLIAPFDNVALTDQKISFTWTAGENDGIDSLYTIEIAENIGIDKIVYKNIIKRKDWDIFLKPGAYRWRVGVIKNDETDFSDYRKIKIVNENETTTVNERNVREQSILKRNNLKLQNDIEDYKKQINILENKISEYEKDQKKFENNSADSKKQITGLQSAGSHISADNSDKKNPVDGSLNLKFNELKAKYEELLENNKLYVVNMTGKLTDAFNERKNLQKEIEEYIKKLQKLDVKLYDSENERKKLAATFKGLNSEIADLKISLDDYKSEITKRKQQISNKNSEMLDLSRELNKVKEQLVLESADKSSLKAGLKKAKEDFTSIEKEISELRAVNNNLNISNQKKADELVAASKSFEELKLKYTNSLNDSKKQYSAFEDKILAAENKVLAAENKILTKENENKRLNSLLESKTSELKKSEESNQMKSDEIKRLINDAATIKSENFGLKTNVDKLQGDLQRQTAEFDAVKKTLKETLEKSEQVKTENSALKINIDKLQNDLQSKTVELGAVKKTLDETREKYENEILTLKTSLESFNLSEKYYNNSVEFFKKYDYKNALKEIDRAICWDPKNFDNIIMKLYILNQLGQEREIRKIYDTLTAEQKNHPSLKKIVGFLQF